MKSFGFVLFWKAGKSRSVLSAESPKYPSVEQNFSVTSTVVNFFTFCIFGYIFGLRYRKSP